MQIKHHWSHLLPPLCDRWPSLCGNVCSNIKGEQLFISWVRSVHPIKRENKTQKKKEKERKPLEYFIMLTPASLSPHPPQKPKTAFKVLSILYFPSHNVTEPKAACSAQQVPLQVLPRSVCTLGYCRQYRRCRVTWPCHLGKEPREEELALLLHIQSHSGDYVFLYFFILLKKNSQCQKEQNIIEIAKDDN